MLIMMMPKFIPPSTLSVTAPGIVAVAPTGNTAQGSSTAVVSGAVGTPSFSWAWVGTPPANVELTGTSTATLVAGRTVTTNGASAGIVRVTATAANGSATHDIPVHLENGNM